MILKFSAKKYINRAVNLLSGIIVLMFFFWMGCASSTHEHVLTFPADRPKPADESFWTEGIRSGPFIYFEKTIYDQRYNRIWTIDTLTDRDGPITDNDNDGVSYNRAAEWCEELNAFKYGEQILWRLPTMQELVLGYIPKTRTYTLEKLSIPKHPNLNPEAWYVTSDYKKRRGVRYFQMERGVVLNFRRPKYVPKNQVADNSDAIAVCTGPFDIFNSLKGINATELSPQLSPVIDNALEALRKRNNYVKLEYHIETKAMELYKAQVWRELLEQQLPLKYGVQILSAVQSTQDYMPGFWFEYGHLALLCGDTDTAQAAAQAARRILTTDPVWQEEKHVSDMVAMTAILEALALSEAGFQDKSASAREQAETLIKDYGPYNQNPYLLPYLYDFGERLFEDQTLLSALEDQYENKPSLADIGTYMVVPTRKKLALYFDMDESLLPGVEFFRFTPKEQEFTKLPLKSTLTEGNNPPAEP